jgi:transposase
VKSGQGWLLTAIQEVIPMRSRAYGSSAVKQVDCQKIAIEHDGQDLVVGMDIGKYQMMAVGRWPDSSFERPWRVVNPLEIPELVGLLTQLRRGRRLVVAMEPSGTYGDALRQALHDVGIPVLRIGTKVAHDYAEVFDGVPSQHDGKDAAVVAELAALGKGKNWAYESQASWEQELAYWVERLECYSRIQAAGLGPLEALLGRHWPEATRVLEVSSATLLRILETYGGPAGLAADPKAATQLARWGGTYLSADKVQKLLASARNTVGVRPGDWDSRRLREQAERTRAARREVSRCRRQLQALAKGHPVLEAQGKVVGLATACVLWVCVGDPRNYSCARAYRKAMGLNLVERSSGTYQGKLKISKRGNPRSRQWLYLATIRLVKQAGVQQWYEAKKARDGSGARCALVAVMRKLALALYHVGARGAVFNTRRLFARIVAQKSRAQPAAQTP